MGEAQADVSKNASIVVKAASLIKKVTPLLAAAQNLADISDRLKELLICIKGNATNLLEEAMEVDASIEVTSDNSFTKRHCSMFWCKTRSKPCYMS